jgi:hypothetical protein
MTNKLITFGLRSCYKVKSCIIRAPLIGPNLIKVALWYQADLFTEHIGVLR